MWIEKQFELGSFFRPGDVAGMIYLERTNHMVVLAKHNTAWRLTRWNPEETALKQFIQVNLPEHHFNGNYCDLRGLVLLDDSQPFQMTLLTVRVKMTKIYAYQTTLWCMTISLPDWKITRQNQLFEFDAKYYPSTPISLWKKMNQSAHYHTIVLEACSGTTRELRITMDAEMTTSLLPHIYRNTTTVASDGRFALTGGSTPRLIRDNLEQIHQFNIRRFATGSRKPFLASAANETTVFVLNVDDGEMSWMDETTGFLWRQRGHGFPKQGSFYILREHPDITFAKMQLWFNHSFEVSFGDPAIKEITEYLHGPKTPFYAEAITKPPANAEEAREEQLMKRMAKAEQADRERIPAHVMHNIIANIKKDIDDWETQRMQRKRKREADDKMKTKMATDTNSIAKYPKLND